MSDPIASMIFPSDYLRHKYGLIHFSFFVQYAKVAGVEVRLIPENESVWIGRDRLVWSCLIDDQQVIFDYADHWNRDWKTDYPDLPYFKFQKTTQCRQDIFSLGPPMIGLKRKGNKGATLRDYLKLRSEFCYAPGIMILNKQLPNGAATDRRIKVQKMLKDNFDSVNTDANVDQYQFWQLHHDCLTSVCVPGATNNMVDRGHMELLGLGVCTISPEMRTLFPGEQILQADRDYLVCRDDYRDLIDIIMDLQLSPERSKDIGDNAREFYDTVYSPGAYWRWILKCLSK